MQDSVEKYFARQELKQYAEYLKLKTHIQSRPKSNGKRVIKFKKYKPLIQNNMNIQEEQNNNQIFHTLIDLCKYLYDKEVTFMVLSPKAYINKIKTEAKSTRRLTKASEEAIEKRDEVGIIISTPNIGNITLSYPEFSSQQGIDQVLRMGGII